MLAELRHFSRNVCISAISGPRSRRPNTNLLKLSLIVLFLVLCVHAPYVVIANAQGTPVTTPNEHSGPSATAAPEEHGLSAKAVEIGHVFGFPITNSMVVSWVVALALIIFARLATRRMDQVPSGAQNFLEWLIESL